MPRRSRPTSIWFAAIAFLATGLTTLILTLAAFDTLAAHRESLSYGLVIPPRPETYLLQRSFEVLAGLWFFAVGSSVGSFLNVVAYRMPAGIGLSREGSRCPWCLGAIRARDNIPVLGWLALRGRCRKCRLPISSRYPIVEALTGTMYLLVYLFELTSETRWLPGGPLSPSPEISQIVLDLRLDLLLPCLLHLIALTTLWGAALMIWDSEVPPRRYWVTTLLLLVGLIAIQPLVIRGIQQWMQWPLAQQVPQFPVELLDGLGPRDPVPQWLEDVAWIPLAGGLIGLVIGAAMGAVMRRCGASQVVPMSLDSGIPSQEVSVEGDHEGVHFQAHIAAFDANRERGEQARLTWRQAFADAALPVIIGLVWGWQTLLPVALLTIVLIAILPRLGHFQATAARVRGIAWTLATLVVSMTWNFWVGWALG